MTDPTPKKIGGIVLIVIGVVLFIQGYEKNQSIGSRIGSALGSAPSEPIWLMAGGVAAALVGVYLIVRK